MAEYIGRKAVEEMLENAQLISDGEFCGYCTEDVSITEIPTADVAPVVHGKWELYGNDDDPGSSYFCSRCGASYDEDWFYDHGRFIPFKGCPNCFARMDGE